MRLAQATRSQSKACARSLLYLRSSAAHSPRARTRSNDGRADSSTASPSSNIRAFVDEYREQVLRKLRSVGRSLSARHMVAVDLFLDDGNIELTTTARTRDQTFVIEKRMAFCLARRPVVSGPRILTIIDTCIAHEINPGPYLHWVTKIIVNGWPQARVRDLLPDRIWAEHPELHVDFEPPPALLPAPA